MPLALLMLIQAAPSAPTAVDDFDLARWRRERPAARCDAPTADSTEILVCGSRTSPRLDRLDDSPYAERPPELGFRLLGADAKPELQQRTLPGGLSGPAVMMNFKWKF